MTIIQSRTLQRHRVEAPRVFGGIVAKLARLPLTLVETLLTWQRRADERQRLAALDPRLLNDMGLTEAEAAREAAIPFWLPK